MSLGRIPTSSSASMTPMRWAAEPGGHSCGARSGTSSRGLRDRLQGIQGLGAGEGGRAGRGPVSETGDATRSGFQVAGADFGFHG